MTTTAKSCNWPGIAGRDGADKGIDSELTKDSSKGLVGHLNFIHPNLIQVLGCADEVYLEGLDGRRRAGHRQPVRPELACRGVVADGEKPRRPTLLAAAERRPHAAVRLTARQRRADVALRRYLAQALADSTTLHGVFLDVLGLGVLITGDSGVGKSELALELISRGSGLVADDVVELYRIGTGTRSKGAARRCSRTSSKCAASACSTSARSSAKPRCVRKNASS